MKFWTKIILFLKSILVEVFVGGGVGKPGVVRGKKRNQKFEFSKVKFLVIFLFIGDRDKINC